jgi:hypothetical protein
VENKTRKFNIIVLAVLYCYAIIAVNLSLSHADFSDKSSSSQKTEFLDSSTKLFLHTPQTKSSVDNNYENLPSSNLNNLFNDFRVFFKATEQLIVTEHSRYLTYFISILINHWSYDIIFPFHSFW